MVRWFLLFCLMSGSQAAGLLEIYMTTFLSTGKDSDNDHCDSTWFGKSSNCDHYFNLKVATNGYGNYNLGKYITDHFYYENDDSINFGSKFGKNKNPLTFIVENKDNWSGGFYFYLVVYDADFLNGHDYVDTIKGYVYVKPDYIYRSTTLTGKYRNKIKFSYRFMCQKNYYGSNCNVYCVGQQSSTHGYYYCNKATGAKICLAGWYDSASSCKKKDGCHLNPCYNSGRCIRGLYSGTYTCTCPTQYEGTRCERIKNPCTYKNFCINGGKCYAAGLTALCNCLPQFHGKYCQYDVNECAKSPCKAGTCVNTFGDYKCNCPAELTGKNCETDINECSQSNYCAHGGTCSNNHGGFTCYCTDQWTGSRCQTDRDECINPPSSWNGEPACLNGGTCQNTIGGFKCNCPVHYTGNRCETHRCSTKLCQNGGACKVDPITRETKCECLKGYSGNECETNIDDCATSPCVHGKCSDLVADYHCACSPGYEGKNCDVNINDCANNPCAHGGHCTDLVNDYKCTCPAGYSGKNCQTNIDDCKSDSCSNNGTCVDKVNDFQCLCVAGFTGKRCEENIDECKPKPCLNGGTCLDEVNGFLCSCTDDYEGRFCQKKKDHCIGHICQNNATCVSGNQQTYTCKCPPNYRGKYCDKHADNCWSHPCFNGGVCTNTVDNYICQCPQNYTGRQCRNMVLPLVGNQGNTGSGSPVIPIVSTLVVLLVIVAVICISVFVWRRSVHKRTTSSEHTVAMENPSYQSPDLLVRFQDDNESYYETIHDGPDLLEDAPNRFDNALYQTTPETENPVNTDFAFSNNIYQEINKPKSSAPDNDDNVAFNNDAYEDDTQVDHQHEFPASATSLGDVNVILPANETYYNNQSFSRFAPLPNLSESTGDVINPYDELRFSSLLNSDQSALDRMSVNDYEQPRCLPENHDEPRETDVEQYFNLDDADAEDKNHFET